MARRGPQSALNLRQNRAFIDALDAAEREVYRQWMATESTQEREKLHAEGKALERVTRALEAASAHETPIREVV